MNLCSALRRKVHNAGTTGLLTTLAEAPTAFLEIVGDYFPVIHPLPARDSIALMIISVGLNCGFEFKKGNQLLICTHNKASSVAAHCSHNPNWSAFAIGSRHTAAVPSSVAEIFDDHLPGFHLDFTRTVTCHRKPRRTTANTTPRIMISPAAKNIINLIGFAIGPAWSFNLIGSRSLSAAAVFAGLG